MTVTAPPRPPASARLRLALSYAVFLVAAGAATLAGVYVVLRQVPSYPLTAANPSDAADGVASRGEILAALVGVSGFVLLFLAIVGMAGGWVLAGWVLRPLQRINEAALVATTGRLDHRIGLTGRNDEFKQLADTFDHMLARLHDAFTAQERFAANASHELRTPLTITATLLDVARASPATQDYPTLVERLQITNRRAIGITDALLRLADADAVGAAFDRVDLALVTRASLAELAGEAGRHEVSLDARLGRAPTFGDPTLLGQLVVNLLQNAIRHNVRPGHARVTTAHDPARGTVTFRTENPGAAYTAEAAARLREPFLRGAGRFDVPGQVGGHGLGLALVARIVAAHDGTLAVEPRGGGGLVVTVVLPDGSGHRDSGCHRDSV